MTRYSDDDDDRSLLHKAAWDRDPEALRRLLSQGVTEADETRYDSLIADITRKVAEMASLKGPRASVTATRLSKALDPDSENYSEEDSDDYTACS